MNKNKYDPLELSDLQELLKLLKKPRNFKKLGQNFLIDREVRDKIIAAASLEGEQVLEIGPGVGVLTQELVKIAKRVVAIDIDPYMLEATRITVGDANLKTLDLRLEDVRKINLPKLFCKPVDQVSGAGSKSDDYIVVSNLPYLLTGYIFELLLTSPCSPKTIVVMVQKEVAERILAKPGNYSMLSLSINLFGKVSPVTNVSKESFWPMPKVDSAVIKLERFAKQKYSAEEQKKILKVAKAGFSARRKKLANSLSGGLHISVDQAKKALDRAGLAENSRAQELSVDEWAKLSQIL